MQHFPSSRSPSLSVLLSFLPLSNTLSLSPSLTFSLSFSLSSSFILFELGVARKEGWRDGCMEEERESGEVLVQPRGKTKTQTLTVCVRVCVPSLFPPTLYSLSLPPLSHLAHCGFEINLKLKAKVNVYDLLHSCTTTVNQEVLSAPRPHSHYLRNICLDSWLVVKTFTLQSSLAKDRNSKGKKPNLSNICYGLNPNLDKWYRQPGVWVCNMTVIVVCIFGAFVNWLIEISNEISSCEFWWGDLNTWFGSLGSRTLRMYSEILTGKLLNWCISQWWGDGVRV